MSINTTANQTVGTKKPVLLYNKRLKQFHKMAITSGVNDFFPKCIITS